MLQGALNERKEQLAASAAAVGTLNHDLEVAQDELSKWYVRPNESVIFQDGHKCISEYICP